MPTSFDTPSSSSDFESEKSERDVFLEQSESDEEDGLFLHRQPSPRSRSRRLLALLPWLLTAFFAALSLFLASERKSTSCPLESYELGFNTDIVPATQIPLEQIRFRGSPHFSINGTGSLDPVDKNARWPENMILFGPPSKEIEDNWERLIGKRYFSISEEEATRAWGDKRHNYVDERVGGYTAGLDMFHTLHCVNALRKALYPQHHKRDNKHHHGPFHLEHCLDAIRQTVQCYGSTTLIPTKFREGLRRNYIDSDQVHTCRSFQFLRDFSTSRQKGNENYVERDLSLVDEKKHKIAVARKKGN